MIAKAFKHARRNFVIFFCFLTFIFCILYFSGCGGGGGGTPVTPTTTTTKTTSAGSATVTVTENASANIVVDDSAASGAKVTIPAGTFATDTTVTFASITPGSGGVPSAANGMVMGAAKEITLSQALPSGKSVTVTMPAPTGAVSGQTVDMYKVTSGAWADTGINGTVSSDGKASASVSGFSQLAFVVANYGGKWTGSGTRTSSSNNSFCGSIGYTWNDTWNVTQNGMAFTATNVDGIQISGAMQADGLMSGTYTYTGTSSGCSWASSGTFTGTVNLTASPMTFTSTDTGTITAMSGSCPASSCTMTNSLSGTKQ